MEGLKDSNGVWVSHKEGLKEVVVHYFSDIFKEDTGTCIPNDWPNMFPNQVANQISPIITNEDIKNAIFSIGPLKAPGEDGLLVLFFQKGWELISHDFCQFIQLCFRQCSLPTSLNATLIALVPKTDNPQAMNDLRPISLCNTTYKVITKIIVNKLKQLLSDIISPNQVSFVPGRHITDNIFILQELMNRFRNIKGRKGYIAWKIDLSKAYDRLSWRFVLDILREIGLCRQLRDLISYCLTTVSYRALVNGETTKRINPCCGIRQGDPLSPYLFVLAMEKFSQIIKVAIDNGNWKEVKVSRGGTSFSHIFFTDDLVLFGEATKAQASVMRKCLELFCLMSGQKVNFQKSCAYVSPNVTKEVAKELANSCGSLLTDCLGKYLGVPVIHERVSKRTYANLVDKVCKRLAAWKSCTLNMAGRLTLIKSVTSALPVYTMQTAKLLVSICDKLDRVNRNFL